MLQVSHILVYMPSGILSAFGHLLNCFWCKMVLHEVTRKFCGSGAAMCPSFLFSLTLSRLGVSSRAVVSCCSLERLEDFVRQFVGQAPTHMFVQTLLVLDSADRHAEERRNMPRMPLLPCAVMNQRLLIVISCNSTSDCCFLADCKRHCILKNQSTGSWGYLAGVPHFRVYGRVAPSKGIVIFILTFSFTLIHR